jgi:Putative beta-barrel porin 2
MISRWIRAIGLLALAPAAAFAFETVDELPYPSQGAFPAWPAEPRRPWTLFAYGGLMHDSNVFRRDTDEISDVVGRIGIGAAGAARIVGRQALRGDGFVEYHDYQDQSQLDHTAYRLRGHFVWQIGNLIDGAAGYERERRLADLGEFQIESRDMVTEERIFVDGGYRFAARWRLFGLAEQTRSKRDFDDFTALDENNLVARITHVSGLGNELGLEARVTRGEARTDQTIPGTTQLVNNDFDERELSLVLAYALTGQVRAAGRIGYTERKYDEIAGRDFSDPTYRGSLTWATTPKFSLSFEAFHLPESLVDVNSSHVIRTGTSFGARWAATYKLVFSVRLVNEERESQGDAADVVLGTTVRDETIRTWRFGAGWEVQRGWQLGAGFDVGERSSNELGRDYDYTAFMLNLRWSY